MAELKLYTVGYSGKSLPQLTELLQAAGVKTLVDSRELAWSRKRGFSKTFLKAAVEAAGITYQHEKMLGAPKLIRDRYRETGDAATFFKAYRKHLQSLNGSFSSVVDLAVSRPVCLLCLEAKSEDCHRSALAEKICKESGTPIDVVHL